MFLENLKRIKSLKVDFWPEPSGLISNLDLSELKQAGIEGLILDLDNTIIEPELGKLKSEIRDWLKKALQLEFKLIILTNNKDLAYLRQVEKNLKEDQLEIKIIEKARKPDPQKAFEAIKALGLNFPEDKSKICIIGDQFRTDILLGNLLGTKTAFVKPLKKESCLVKTLRKLDRFLFYSN